VLPDAWAGKLAHWAVRIVAWDIIKITSEIGVLLLFKAKKSQKWQVFETFCASFAFQYSRSSQFRDDVYRCLIAF
jgi:hypothetical protein